MSEPDKSPSDVAQRWIGYAREDMRTAEAVFENEDLPPRNVAFLAQQAAEKAVKAVLIAREVPFPKTHDLVALSRLIPGGLPDVGDEALLELSQWSVDT